MTLEIQPIVYNPKTKQGCFDNMMKMDKYRDALFLYNENVIDWIDWNDSTAGSGTAKIRPNSWSYHQDKPLRALGIPTGFSAASGGFTSLDGDSKKAINLAFHRVVVLLQKSPHISRVIYSADTDNVLLLGTKLFKVSTDVLEHISEKIWALPVLVTQPAKLSLGEIRLKEIKRLLPRARNAQALALAKMEIASLKRKRERDDDGQESSITRFLSRSRQG